MASDSKTLGWEATVIVKVERIRRGRRLPEVEYVEAPSPRRWRGHKLQLDGDHGNEHVAHRKQSRSGLRLPWQIKKEPV
jgi:hypothetical protein